MYQGFAKFIRGKAFSIIFMIASLISIDYISLRIGSILNYYFAVQAYWFILIILLALFTYMFLYYTCKGKIRKTRSLYELCSVILSFILNLILFLLLEDWIGIFVSFPNDGIYVLAVIGSILLTLYGFLHANHIFVKQYSVKLNKNGSHTKIALLSDIHTGTFVNQKQLHKIIEKTNQLKSDYILISGDTFDVEAFEHCNLSDVSEELKKLKAVKGVYAVLGNHDPASTNSRVLAFFQKSKIKLLIDETIETEDFILIGRDDVNTNPKRKELAEILQEAHSEKPKILIDHNPVGILDGIKNNVDLVLCGHTHKGQFFPATLFTKWAYGKQGFYGYSKTNSTHSIVSSGTGYFQMAMRVGTNSEIVEIDIE